MKNTETQSGSSLQRVVRPPTPDPLTMRDICAETMRDICADFVKSNGWSDIVTTMPGSPQIKMLYKSPLTGHYHSLTFALGKVLEHHGIPAA